MIYYGKPKIETIEKRKAEYIRCDSCNKKIRKQYYEVTTGHHDWGRDSIDSVEHNEICESCINKFVAEYLKENKECYSNYIDIEKESFDYISLGDYDRYKDRLVENDNNE